VDIHYCRCDKPAEWEFWWEDAQAWFCSEHFVEHLAELLQENIAQLPCAWEYHG
jgi:hypothetical protein